MHKVLILPTLRYVDDYFGVEHPDEVDHAAKCFNELMECLLGPETVAPNKLLVGNPLEILGVDCQCCLHGFAGRPSRSKKEKWLVDINMALFSKVGSQSGRALVFCIHSYVP